MTDHRSGFSSADKSWTPDDPSVLVAVCTLLAGTLGKSHGDRGVSTFLSLAASMPTGVVIDLGKITDAQRKSLQTAVKKCLSRSKKVPPAELAGLRELAALLACAQEPGGPRTP